MGGFAFKPENWKYISEKDFCGIKGLIELDFVYQFQRHLRTQSKNAPTVSKRNITQVKLFDNLGNLKKQQSTAKTKQLSMNISGLTPGIYFLEISDGAFKERQKVVIQ